MTGNVHVRAVGWSRATSPALLASIGNPWKCSSNAHDAEVWSSSRHAGEVARDHMTAPTWTLLLEMKSRPRR
jgi:hypothetical protein